MARRQGMTGFLRSSQPHFPLLVPKNQFDNAGEFPLARKIELVTLVKVDQVMFMHQIFSRYSLAITRWLFTSTKRHSQARNHATAGGITAKYR